MAGAEPHNVRRMTTAEFLAWDGGGLTDKLELVNGEVRAMPPASGTHSLIQANLTILIGNHLKAKNLPCRVGTEAPVVPQLHANDNVRAPDLAVTCLDIGKSKTFPDPILIVEVMSPSNQRETWESIYAMATIRTLLEIAVVESDRVRVEVFRRNPDGGWPKGGEVFEAGCDVVLRSIDAALPIPEIYAGTHLA